MILSEPGESAPGPVEKAFLTKKSVDDNMDSILIKDTTREEREQIVAESIGNINGACDGCAAGLADMYLDYIEGKKEIRDINREFSELHDPKR